MTAPDRIQRTLARVVRYRIAIIVLYALLVPAAALLATSIPSEEGIGRLIVASDPDVRATREYHEIFPEPQLALLVFESPDPWSPSSLERVDRARAALAAVPRVTAYSVVDMLRRARPGADPETLRALANGTPTFRRQGLAGDTFLAIVVNLAVVGPTDRDTALDAIDVALARSGAGAVRKIGTPYVNAWLERAAGSTMARSLVVLGVLLVSIVLFLFRSLRALIAIVLALGSTVALALGAGSLLGFEFTIVSALVPLTVMVTTLATLTYLHSRYVDQPEGVPLAEHQLFALRTKLLPVTASTIAAATGFAALAVSKIQPIRQMGIWTALGLLISWIVAYTLFPALQRVLRTPTGRQIQVRTKAYDRVSRALPELTYRHRKAFVAGALAFCVAGALAVTGVPGIFSGLPVAVDVLTNIDPASRVARDIRWFRAHASDLNVAHVWIHLPHPAATEPEVLHAIDRYATALDATTNVTGVTGPTTPLRMRSYFAGRGESLPRDPAAFASAVQDVEQLLLSEPELRAFIDASGLADLQLTVLFRDGHAKGYNALTARAATAWTEALATSPSLAGATMRVVGTALLDAKISESLVPTLAESLVLTVVVILMVFLIVFRSGTERLLAMIPSLFALLVTFLGLRLFGGTLNVATIIIATTVLGTTENDQMHFFHHLHEGPRASLEARLHHTLQIAGRAIVFATVINAIGFLGLAPSSFPPLRQFGLMTASAFVLALLADFLVLPAALWLASGERPASVAPPAAPPAVVPVTKAGGFEAAPAGVKS
ncbi:MAG TPA: MMPL family transporter [Kofleriaceae bacterium]|nr:MMPL family transporter [Kofleriaceae bacterium]